MLGGEGERKGQREGGAVRGRGRERDGGREDREKKGQTEGGSREGKVIRGMRIQCLNSFPFQNTTLFQHNTATQ